jgi:hypothetical protein
MRKGGEEKKIIISNTRVEFDFLSHDILSYSFVLSRTE